jgi:catechol 2,3-dioxygenase-like lactoylglutathione lyase family enzyme
MFSAKKVTATIPANNLERAKKFYADKLGLKPEMEREDGIVYDVHGTEFLLYPTQFAGTAKHTLVGFETENLEKDMQELRNKGVVFEEYDMPNLKTVNGVAKMGDEKGAWFKDSEGNILAITEMPKRNK